MNKFKVGDYVSGKLFEGVKQISAIDTGANFFTIKVDGIWGNPNNLTLVCNFTKGQEIEVSQDFNDFVYTEEFLFYYPNLEKPFVTIDSGKNVSNWQFARPIQPVYTPYKEFDYSMLDTVLKVQGTNMEYIIVGYMFDIKTGDVLLQKTCGVQCIAKSLTDLYECFTRVDDGTPFGELIT